MSTDVMQRLQRLERSHRWQRVIILALLLFVCCRPPLGAEIEPGVLVARRFVATDKDGTVRAMIGTFTDGSSGINICDKASQVRASLMVAPTGYTLLRFDDRAGRNRAAVTVEPDGSATFTVTDVRGKVVWKGH